MSYKYGHVKYYGATFCIQDPATYNCMARIYDKLYALDTPDDQLLDCACAPGCVELTFETR